MPVPNILLITTDQHNAEIMGCAGNKVVDTPNLDRLAGEGIVCGAAFTPHPLCTPARTSIFTGLDARHHTVSYNIDTDETKPNPPNRPGLPEDIPTFPEILAQHSYATALFGKLHTKQQGGKRFGLQYVRLAEGKAQFIAYGSAPDDYRQYLKAKGYPDGAWRTWELSAYGRDGFVTSPLSQQDYIDTWTATEALVYLSQFAPEASRRKPGRPFFAWVSFSGPHTPWDPPQPYDEMYDPDEIPLPARRAGELEEKHPSLVDAIAKTRPALPNGSVDWTAKGGLENAYGRLSDREIRAMLAAYYGQVSLIDAQVGRLLSFLDESGLSENTLLVFTADHGEQLGNNWTFYKHGVFYDALARVPFIVRWPGHTARGKRCAELVSLLDLTPTFLQAAGIEGIHAFDGRSLLLLLKGHASAWREELLLESSRVSALLTRQFKYLRWLDGFVELYDRQRDPHDLHNLARDTERYGALCEILETHLNALQDQPGGERTE